MIFREGDEELPRFYEHHTDSEAST